MRLRPFSPARAGFTLIELTLSAALMSLILAAAYLCLRGCLLSRKLIQQRTDIFQNARVAIRLLTDDLRSACPLAPNEEFLGMHRRLGNAPADNLDFATHHYTPRRPREADWCEVSYFVNQDPRTGGFVLWRRRDFTPDDKPLSGGHREEIARGLRGVRFEYTDGFDWYDNWGDPEAKRKDPFSLTTAGNLYGLPEAVRITLQFDSEPHPRTERAQPVTLTVTSGKTNAPPMVFQTIVYLELAEATANSANQNSGSTGGTGTGNQLTPQNR